MVAAATTDDDFIRSVESIGIAATARKIGVDRRNVIKRRNNLERKYRRQITPPDPQTPRKNIQHPGRIGIEVRDGVVLVGSDAHIWPGPESTAQRAFVKFCADMQPRAVVMNGDVVDFSSISRHPQNWEKAPTVQEEIESAQEWLHKIEKSTPRKCELIWTLGNHDSRMETFCASNANQLKGLKGIHLKDHFPLWKPCWSVWVNDEVVVKHRWKGGIHATHNNAMGSGKSIVTGHLHSLKITPWTTYDRTIFGVDTGCLATCYGAQFLYAEDNSRNWRSGFVVLTFRSGRLMWPEVVHVIDEDHVEFRSEIIKV